MRVILATLAALMAGGAAPPAKDIFATLPDHRRIHFSCSGQGSPTVILEAGFGADGTAWYKVQPALAQKMRVCAYDRAGMGLSDPGPSPRDGKAIAADLNQALHAAKINGPLIGVGHSAGGLYIRLLAAQRTADMRGLVLVDPSVEHQTKRIEAIYGPGAGSIEGIKRLPQRCFDYTSKPPLDPKSPTYAECVGKATDPAVIRSILNPGHWRTEVSEIETLFTTTSDQVVEAQARIRGVPTIILSAGSNKGQPADAGQALQQRFHRELAGQFKTAEARPVDSGHMMFFDRPEAIVQAVEQLAGKSGAAATKGRR